MDCNDVETDRRSMVRTVTVVHGKRYATRVAWCGTWIMSLLTLIGPLQKLIPYYFLGYQTDATKRFLMVSWRQFLLGAVGCGSALWRGWRVVKTEGSDADLVSRTIDEGLLTVLFVLASFL